KQLSVWNLPRECGKGRLALSPDGKTIAVTAEWLRTVFLLDAANGKPLSPGSGHNGPVWAMAFSPDGKRLATAGHDQSIRLWDLATGEELRTFHSYLVWKLAFSPDGKRLAYAGPDGNEQIVGILDPHNVNSPIEKLRGHSKTVTALAFSPDGQMLAYGSTDN